MPATAEKKPKTGRRTAVDGRTTAPTAVVVAVAAVVVAAENARRPNKDIAPSRTALGPDEYLGDIYERFETSRGFSVCSGQVWLVHAEETFAGLPPRCHMHHTQETRRNFLRGFMVNMWACCSWVHAPVRFCGVPPSAQPPYRKPVCLAKVRLKVPSRT